MIKFKEYTLDNGLHVVLHKDENSSIAVTNLLYDVGSRDEDENQTGFAHLFEHFMFEGSQHIPNYDIPLQEAGGDSNAFTNPDCTNYYNILPAVNLETALWLESDRMLGLAFEEESLATQKSVVMEEFKEHYLNKPYGDQWHLMLDLAYTHHPYRWPTIGKNLSHIEGMDMKAIKDFFTKHYAPNNAYLSIAGNFDEEQVRQWIQTYFGSIPSKNIPDRQLPKEPKQQELRRIKHHAFVESNALIVMWHCSARMAKTYPSEDILSDILGSGRSSRCQKELIDKQQLFADLNVYVLGSLDPGLLVFEGRLHDGVSHQAAEDALWKMVETLQTKGLTDQEFKKVINKTLTDQAMDDLQLQNIAYNLSFFASQGDTNGINTESDLYNKLKASDIQEAACRVLSQSNASVIHYCKTGASSTS
ncbi:MAG: pitrilysin family protein [Bacteroidota bacterium]|nr:pitrilysin family protein [Bacteroidota bacterium]